MKLMKMQLPLEAIRSITETVINQVSVLAEDLELEIVDLIEDETKMRSEGDDSSD